MRYSQTRIFFYVGSYSLIIILIILGLMINIKVVHINEKKLNVKSQIQSFREENQRLYLEILMQNTLAKTDEKAQSLDLHSPEKIEFLTVPR